MPVLLTDPHACLLTISAGIDPVLLLLIHVQLLQNRIKCTGEQIDLLFHFHQVLSFKCPAPSLQAVLALTSCHSTQTYFGLHVRVMLASTSTASSLSLLSKTLLYGALQTPHTVPPHLSVEDPRNDVCRDISQNAAYIHGSRSQLNEER